MRVQTFLGVRAGGPSAPRRVRSARQAVTAYLLIAPAMLGLAVFVFLPIASSATASLYAPDYSSGSPTPVFVGLANYATLAQDPDFWDSVRTTILFNVVVNPVEITIALALALALSTRPKGFIIIQSIFMVPFCVSLIVAVLVWRSLLGPNALVNSGLQAIGLPSQPFLLASSQALWTIGAVVIWAGASFWALVLLAGLRTINADVIEAAALDGANRVQLLLRVILPLLRRTLLFALVIATTENFLLFSPVQLLTLGGPERSTDLLMFRAYQTSFVLGDVGVGNSIVVVLLLIMIVFAAVEFHLMGNNE
jgi:multiple sugar transport system permease protein